MRFGIIILSSVRSYTLRNARIQGTVFPPHRPINHIRTCYFSQGNDVRPQLFDINLQRSKDEIVDHGADELENAFQLKNSVKFTKALSSQSFKLKNSDILKYFSKEWIDSFDLRGLTALSNGLGRIQFNCSNHNERNVCSLILDSALQFKNHEISGIVRLLSGLAKCNFILTNTDTRDQLFAVLEKQYINVLTARELRNLFYSLGKMGISWSDIPPKLQQLLLSQMVTLQADLVIDYGALTVYALGKFQFPLSSFEIIHQNVVFHIVSAVFKGNTETNRQFGHDIANTLIGLTNMGIMYQNLPSELAIIIQQGLTTHWESLNPQAVANVLHSLAGMEVIWSTHLSQPTQDALCKAIATTINKMTPQGYANTIYALGAMETKWADLSPNCQESLLQTMSTSLSSKLNTQEISMTALGFGKMELSTVIVSKFRETLFKMALNVFQSKESDVFSQQFSNTVLGLSKMQLTSFQYLPKDLQKALLDNLATKWQCFNAQAISSILLSLADLNVSWDNDLSHDARKGIFQAVNKVFSDSETTNQSISNNSMQAIAVLSFDAKQDLQLLSDLQCFFLGLLEYRMASIICDVRQMAQATALLELLHTIQLENRSIIESLQKLRPVTLLDTKQVNWLHETISTELSAELTRRSNKYRVENEFHGLKGGYMPVDCAIYFEDKLVALIEIDGPSHYTSEGGLTRQSQFKTFLYTKNYPDVAFMRFKGIVTDPEGVAVAATMIADAVVKFNL